MNKSGAVGAWEHKQIQHWLEMKKNSRTILFPDIHTDALKKRKSYTGSSTDWPSSFIGGSLFCFSLSFLLVSSFFLFSFSTTGLRRRRTSTSPRPPTARPTDKLNSQKKQQTNSLGKQNHRAFPSQFRTSVLRNSHPPHSALSRAILKPYYY